MELLGALEKKEQLVTLTALGKKMASFPLEPRYAKVKFLKKKYTLPSVCIHFIYTSNIGVL